MVVVVVVVATVPMSMAVFPAMFMAVVPQLGLVEQEEKHQPAEQRGEQIIGAGLAFKRLGQQVHEGCGQQRASRQAQHVLGVACQHAKAEQRGQPDAADASS